MLCCFLSTLRPACPAGRKRGYRNVSIKTEPFMAKLHIRNLAVTKDSKLLQSNDKAQECVINFSLGFPQKDRGFPQCFRMWKTDYASVFPPEVFHRSGSFARKIMSFSVENHVETVGNMHLALYIHEYSQHALYPASNPFCGKRKRWERSGKQRGSRLVSGCFVQNGDVHSGF